MAEESGIIIRESKNYLLYKKTEHYIRKGVLPIDVTCSKCTSELTIDMPRDIYYRDDVWNDAYYEQRERYEDFCRRYLMISPGPSDANPNPKHPKYHTPQLCINCPLCGEQAFITEDVQRKVHDIEPIMNHYREEAKHSTATTFPDIPIEAWCALYIISVVALALILNFIF